MTYTERVIRKMIEGGWIKSSRADYHFFEYKDEYYGTEFGALHYFQNPFLDTDAWCAFARAEKWSAISVNSAAENYFVNLVRHLFTGGTIESYCKELIEK